MSKKIAIGSDHAGFELKESMISFLKKEGYQVIDKGCFSSERADYPDFGHAVANAVLEGESEMGIVMCGSGIGISISANRHKGIRAALCWSPEVTKLARQHNDANILVLPARFMDNKTAHECTKIFLSE